VLLYYRPTALVSTQVPFSPNQVHHRPGLLLDRSTTDHQPSVGQILPAHHRRRWWRRTPM
jgi:hypothetical protein